MKKKKTSAKRKLVPKIILDKLYYQKSLGVPLTKLLTNHQLQISRISLTQLLNVYEMLKNDVKTSEKNLTDEQKIQIANSLFPAWLTDSAEVQQTPDGWHYVGYFPFGEWRND